MTIHQLLRHHGIDPKTVSIAGLPVDDYDARDRGTGAINSGEPQQVLLSGREYERYLEGALNEPQAMTEAEWLNANPPVEHAVQQLLQALDVPEDENTADTPSRAAKMWRELLAGYADDPATHLGKTFPADTRDPGLVVQSGIEVTSVCAHHLLPFTGTATVAYRPSPGQRVVGLSKLARLVQGYARRLQIQERIGAQVVTALMDALCPSGAVCLITATHDCMRLRGVRDHGSRTTTMARGGLLLPEELSLIQAQHLA